MVNFLLNSVARSIGVSRYTCFSTSHKTGWERHLQWAT